MKHEVPRFGIVSNIPPLLLDWWQDLSSSDKKHMRKYLGNLPSLLDIEPNNKVIQAATLFWDSERAVFHFEDIEMTPLLEEIGGLVGLTWDSFELLVPEKCTGKGFLKMMGLKMNVDLVCLKESYIPFKYMYERYGHCKSFYSYHDEISLTSLGHIHRRVFVFIVCFLGLIAFSMKKGRIHSKLGMVGKTLNEGINGQIYHSPHDHS